MSRYLTTFLFFVLLGTALIAQVADPKRYKAEGRDDLPSFQEKISGLRHLPGLMDVYVDDDEGHVWLAVPIARDEAPACYLYVEGLASGLGSNPVGLDRGQIGSSRVVEFRRFGNRVLLVEPNLDFRARAASLEERRAAAESFATSVLWSARVASLDAGGVVLVEVTSLLVVDAHGSAAAMKAAGQGNWALDKERSVLDVAATLAFPDNLEFDAWLTFTSEKPGREVRATAPSPGVVSLVQHHSFVRLPGDNYQPRLSDLRMGVFEQSFTDFAAPIDEQMEVRFVVRHRLQHTDSSDRNSTVVDPLIYYVDRGAPEPVRSALVDGASWWSEAFASAGFPGAFRVELLPKGAHPLDVRYNVIQWVHRETRGWSYGGGVRDPRTGEMIKGHVTLGSQRIRQDRLIFEGLLGVNGEFEANGIKPIELSLARIRQLAAHEVGHTLGLAHNFSASTMGRNSVMDYPAPEIRSNDSGDLVAERAYAVGIGAWDKLMIRFLYTETAPGADEAQALAAIVEQSLGQDYRFHSDSDARAPGSAVPDASLWDTGANPIEALVQTYAVRRIALENFGEKNLANGRPRAAFGEVLAPLYFYHRYQLEAAIKTLGGLDFQHGVHGDLARPLKHISAERQRSALEGALEAIRPSFLGISNEKLDLLVPYPPNDNGSVERFASRTGPVFDWLAAAETAARMVAGGILQRERCARLVAQHLVDEQLPGLDEVLERLCQTAWANEAAKTARDNELSFAVRRVIIDAMIELASDPLASPAVRERVEWCLHGLGDKELAQRSGPDHAHSWSLAARVARFLNRSQLPRQETSSSPAAPPGSPIGSVCDF